MINNNVFIKTRKKLIINIMLVVEIFMILMSFFIYNYFKVGIYNTIDRALLDEFHFVNNQFSSQSIMDPIVLQDPKDIVYIYEGNKVIYYTQNRYFSGSVPLNTINRDYGNFFEGYNGYNFRTAIIKNDHYEFRIMRNIDSEKESLSHMLVLLISADFFSLLLVYIIAKYLSKKALKPIEMSWNNQVKFVQDASHELRTPVAIIQSKLESLLKAPESTIEDEAETVAVAMRETRQLKKMISELLSLTKEESIVSVNNSLFSIEDLFAEIFESYHEIAEYQNKTFDYSIDMKNYNIYTDRNKMTNLIRILIDNAFKYTEEGDFITIKSSEKGRDRIQIIVSDTGIGISEKDQKHIFERFFRSSSVRATEIEGSGIGLSIAAIITNTLGGHIKVKSTLGEGTSFIIDLARGMEVKKKKSNKKKM